MTHPAPLPRILIYLKAPRIGTVKTRLAREVGDEAALAIYRELVERQLRQLPAGWPVEIHHAPADAGDEMRAWLGPGYDYHPQCDGDLGARLVHGFASNFARGARAVLAIGGDCPTLDASCLEQAARELLVQDVVLGPATDGGYYLIGLRQNTPELFTGIPWSTAEVLGATLRRAKAAGLSVHLLDEKEDIDDAAAWRRFQAQRLDQDRREPAAQTITVIIPALNEAAAIGPVVMSVRQSLPEAAIVVVDGGSSDATASIAAAAGAEVVTSDRGRGRQCRAGAGKVQCEWMLFLHADTTLPANAEEIIARFTARPTTLIATFRLRFDRPNVFLQICCWFTRFDSVFTRFGDQGILIRRTFYEQLGGFPDWPLFEDVALLQRARACTRVHSLPAYVTTSARRFRQHGPLRQQMQNARLLLRYLLGASPEDLAREYRSRGNDSSRT